MIIHALNDYYERMEKTHPGELAEFGFERKAIPVIFELTEKGELHQIYIDKDKNAATKYVLPKAVKRSVNIEANLLWDNAEYTLGLIRPGGKKENVKKRHRAFIEKIEQLDANDDCLGDIDKNALEAINFFLKQKNLKEIKQRNDFDEKYFETNPNISFKLVIDTGLICERPQFRQYLENSFTDSETKRLCLVTGSNAPIARLHPSIKGVFGAKTTGANIVSFDKEAFQSFNKKQGQNAPVSDSAVFKYTEALNYLLRRGSTQQVRIGDSSAVFWSEEGDEKFENAFLNLMAKPEKSIRKDDPNKNVAKVKSALEAFYKGCRISAEEDQRFYVLGLAPNVARIAVRFWKVTTIKELSTNILQHFKDIEICHYPNDVSEIPLFKLLSHVCLEYKTDNLPPNLAGELARSILDNSPYPYTLLTAAVRRNRAEQGISHPRAAIIKACLNRQIRHNQLNQQELCMALDIENTDIPYLMGRWFATLEKIQQDSHRGINATIKDRYYGAISSSPVSVFSILDRLKNHHLAKLENTGLRVTHEKRLDEIIGKLPAQLPKHFSLQEQGCFAIGYHHQRHDFFKPKQELTEQVSQSSSPDSGD